MNQSMAYTPKASDKGTFSRLLAYLRPHTKALLLAFILLLVGTAADVIGPILIKTFIDKYLSPRFFPLQQMLILGGGYLLLQLSTAVFNYLQLVSFQKIALKVIQRLRVDVFHNVQRLGLSFFDRTPTGALVSRITNDTEAIKDLYVSVLSTFVQNTVLLTGIFISMFALNVHLALLCLVLIPIIITIMEVYRRFSSKVFHAARQRLSQLNAQLSESLQGMSLIQALRQERRIQKEFETVNHAYKSARIKNIQLNGLLLRPLVDVVYLLTLMLVLGFFGSQSLTQTIDIGALYAFINYLDRFFEPVNAMMMRLNLFQQAIVSADRVFALMDEDDLAPSKLGTEHPVIDQGLVSFEHVTFSYDGKSPVLKDITFTAYPGQTVALVGHTGSGKSSITNLLMRFYAIEQGTIRIDGRDIRNYDNNELRHQIGLVLQDPFLFVGDIERNIRLGNDTITHEVIVESAKYVQADAFIRRFKNGYAESLGERGATLSSGQRQLLSFARTMAIKPRILVLDEATANIDTETEEAISSALQKMRKGRTTIAIAHRLSTIQDADLILVLHQGEIVERGTHQELLNQNGLYHKMFLLQQGAALET